MHNNLEEKVIMYDDPNIVEYRTDIKGWIYNGQFYGKDENQARYNACTHKTCQECKVNIHKKSYTMCDTCRHKRARERYLALPYKEWDGNAPVCTWDGDEYFFNLDDIQEHMTNHGLEDIGLLFCEPVHYSKVQLEYIADEAHENWEPEQELVKALDALNAVIDTLPPHSYTPGKIRTSYTYELPWISCSDRLPTIEDYYKVRYEDGETDELPFRIRPKKGINGFMTELTVTEWLEN